MLRFLQLQESTVVRRSQILNDLARLVDQEALVSSSEELRAFETDALTAYRRPPLAAVLPRTTAEVSAILQYCNAQNIRVVPRGAGTSLAGGAIPQEDAIVVCISKMTEVIEVDCTNRFIRVQAGITNLRVTEAVSRYGFFYAPDPSSQLACTIAGNIAMNSGGAHCLKYGVTTNHLIAAEFVLADGTVVEVGRATDIPGLDLLGVLCGSEGQLGIVTEATLRILPSPEAVRPVLFGFASSEDAGTCAAAIVEAGIVPVAIEFMDKLAIEITEAYAHAGYPLDVEAMLIVEVEGSSAEISEQLALLIEIARANGACTIKEAQSALEAALIWKGRKSAFGATGRVADYICMDGTVPMGQLPFVLKRTREIVQSYGLRVANVFHAGDGNMHPLIMFDINDPQERNKAEQAGNDILKLCVEVGGCLTGEHGVGLEKRDLMTLQFSAEDLRQQMAVKTAFDPMWLLNPSKVFPLDFR
ncbi:MAG: FAD-binding protein [Rhizobiales bacterium]|nr:FAD-binding protein [Hyphomicrobiales bacterium]